MELPTSSDGVIHLFFLNLSTAGETPTAYFINIKNMYKYLQNGKLCTERNQNRLSSHDDKESTTASFTLNLTLQEFLSIATKFTATTIFRCNKMRYYHKITVRGNRIYVLPQAVSVL